MGFMSLGIVKYIDSPVGTYPGARPASRISNRSAAGSGGLSEREYPVPRGGDSYWERR